MNRKRWGGGRDGKAKSVAHQSSATASTLPAAGRLLQASGANYVGQMFESKIPLFPLISDMTNDYDSTLVKIHGLVDVIQVLAFALVPYHGLWSSSMEGIARALLFTHLPLFDSSFLRAGMVGCLIATSLVLLVLLITYALAAIFLYIADEDLIDAAVGAKTYKVLGHVVAFFGTVAFIPTLQNFVALAYCLPNSPNNAMLWFTEFTCRSAASGYAVFLATVGTVLLSGISYVVNTLMFEVEPMSRHLHARANSTLDAWYLGFRLVSVVLMHHFVSTGTGGVLYFSLWTLVAPLLLASAYCYCIPYYRRVGQQLRVGSLLSCSFLSLFSLLAHHESVSDVYRRLHLDTILVLSLTPVAFIGFTKVSLHRTSRVFLSGLRDLEEGYVSFNTNFFCRGLPENDQVFDEALVAEILKKHHTTAGARRTADGADNAAECMEENSTATEEADEDDYNFTLPYIDEVSCALDVELAARFLIYSRKRTGRPLTKHQLVFAIRLYSKGISLFREHAGLRFGFANFLQNHADLGRQAQQAYSILRSMEAPLWVRYHAFKEQQRLGTLLNSKTSSRLAAYTRAKKRHHDALQSTVEFWQLLLNDDTDKEALASSTREILAAKKEVLAAYVRLLERHPASMELVASYSVFCETVLDDNDATAACNQYLTELRDARQSSAMRGAKGGRNTRQNDTVAQLPIDFDADDADSGAANTKNAVFLRRSKYLLLFIVFLIGAIALALLIEYMVTNKSADNQLLAIYRSGVMRSLTAHAAVSVSQYVHLVRSNQSAQAIQRAGVRLMGIQNDFRALHNSLTYGELQPAFAAHRDFFRDTQLLRFQGAQMGFWTLGTLVSVALRDIHANPLTSVHVDWATNELPGAVAVAVNQSATLYREGYAHQQQVKEIVVFVVAIAGLVSLVVLVLVSKYNSTMIATSRSDIFSLFMLIPRDVIKRMVKRNKKKLSMVTEFFAMKTKEKVFSRIGAGEDEKEELQLHFRSRPDDDDDTSDTDSQRKHSTAESSSKLDSSQVSDLSHLSQSQLGILSGRDKNTEKRVLERTFFGETTGAAVIRVSLMCALAVSLLVVAFVLFTIPQHRDEQRNLNIQLIKGVGDLSTNVLRRIEELGFIIGHPFHDHLTTYQRLRAAANWNEVERLLLRVGASAEEMGEYNDIINMNNALEEVEQVALRLATPSITVVRLSGRGDMNLSFTEAAGKSWEREGTDLAIHRLTHLFPGYDERHFAELPASVDALNDDGTVNTANFNASTLLRISKDVLFSTSVRNLASSLNAQMRRLVPAAFQELMANAKRDQEVLIAGGIACCAFLLVGAVLHGRDLFQGGIGNKKRDIVFTIAIAGLILVALPVLLTSLIDLERHRAVPLTDKLHAAQSLHFTWTRDFSTMIRYLEAYLNSDGDLLWLLRYRDEFKIREAPRFSSSDDRESERTQAADACCEVIGTFPEVIRDQAVAFPYMSSAEMRQLAQERADVIVAAMQEVQNLYEIAIVLLYYVRTPNQNIINASFLHDIKWNISAEPDYRFLMATYSDVDTLTYTTREADLQLNDTAKIDLSISVAISIRLGVATYAAFNNMNDLLVRVLNDIEDQEDAFARRQHATYLLLLVLCSVSLAFVTLSSIDVFARFSSNVISLRSTTVKKSGHHRHASSAAAAAASTQPGAEANASAAARRGSAANPAETTDGALLSTRNTPYIAAAIFGLLLIAMMAVAGAQVVSTTSTPLLIDRATHRSLLLGRSMLVARRMLDPENHISAMMDMQHLVEELRQSSQALYFDHKGSFFSVGRDATFDSMLFDRGDIEGVNVFSACNSSRAAEIQQQLALGTGLLYDDLWVRAMQSVASAPVPALPSAVSEMEKLYEVMLVALTATSSRLMDGELERSRSWQNLFIGIAAAMIVVAFLSSFFVVLPYIAHLAREESSARLMLRIIPEDAAQRNSQIASYLEFGSVDASGDGESLDDAIATMSTVPVVAIDFRGIIVRFTPAAEHVFGYSASEVLGSNVKMLMPADVAAQHDGYLATYRRTRVKHIIDSTRRVNGLRKDQSAVPLELSVTELRFNDEDSAFIAFMRDVSSEQELSTQDKLNRYITEMSHDPIVTIDEMGLILSVNNATSQVFGYSREELLRENVKMLMPSELALQHDGFLQRYRETGEKHVVDSVRHVQAQRKSGEIFQVKLTVREIKGDMGQPSTFIGYVIDISQEYLAAAQNELNDIISDLSPVPIIGINHAGAFIKFSRAAAELFGYNRDDLISRSRNVQILVPSKYGNHDQYLKRYFDTGVKTVIDVTRSISCLKRDGTEFPAELTVREIKKAGMQPVFLAYLVDITQSLRVMEEADVTNAIVSFSMIPVVATDTKGIVTLFNDAAELNFGYSRSEIVGSNVSAIMPPHIGKQHDAFIHTYLRTREKHVVDTTRAVTARRKDGTTFAAELTLKEVEESARGPGAFFAYIRDVTQHRLTLQQYMINDAITGLSTLPIIGINSKGIIEAFSPAAEACFGFTVSEAMGENVKMLMPPEVAANHDEYIRQYHRTGEKKVIDKTVTVTGLRKSGELFTLEVSAREIRKDGQQSSFVAYLRDTSGDKQLENERNFGSTIRDLSPIPIVQTDKNGILTYVNQAMLSEWGYADVSEVVGQNVKMIMPDNLAESHDDHVARFRDDPTGQQHSTVVGKVRRLLGKRRNGSIFEVEAKIQCVRSDRSDMFILIGFLRNLATQLKLEEANYTIDTLSNLSTVPIIAIDHRGVVIKFSSAAEKAWGYSHKDVEGNNVKMLMPENVAEKHDSYLRMYFKTGVRVVIDNTLRQEARHKDGHSFPVDLAVKEIRKAGQDSLFIGYVRDASDDSALESAMQQAKTVIDANPIPIVVTNRRGVIGTFNEAAARLFDYEREEVIGCNVSMLMLPEDAKFHDRYLKLYAKNRIKNAIDATKVRKAMRKDGTPMPVEITVREVIPTSGDLTQTKYLSFIKDLTAARVLHQAGMINDAIASITYIPLITIDSKGTIVRFSESAERCFDYTSVEVAGKNVSMLMPTEIAKEHDSYLQRYFARNTSAEATFERRVTAKRRSGECFPAKLSVREVRKAGQESMFVGYLEDMASQFEADLQRRIVDSAVQLTTIPMITIDPTGVITEFNAAAEECFGYIRKEVMGHNVSLLMPKKVAELHNGFINNYLATGVKTVIDKVRNVTGKRRDGRKFPLEISVREIRDEEQHYFVGYLKDTTNFFALKEAVAINDSVVNLAPSPLVIINEKGIIEVFSPAAERAFGYVASEVVGENVSRLMPAKYAEHHDSFISRYCTTREPRIIGKVTRNLTALRKGGGEFPIELKVGEVQVGGVSQFVGIVRDISHEGRLELAAAMGEASESMTTSPLIAINASGAIIKANQSACLLFEYTAEELLNYNVKMLMLPEVAAHHDEYLRRYKTTGVKTVVDSERAVVAVKKGGQHVPILLKVREIICEQGSVFVAHLADEGERKRRDYAENLVASLRSLIPTPIVQIDTAGAITTFNAAAEKVFEFTASQVIGKNVSILMPSETQRSHDQYIAAYLRTGEKRVIDVPRRVVGETKSGKHIQLEILVRELKTPTAHCFIGSLRPLSE